MSDDSNQNISAAILQAILSNAVDSIVTIDERGTIHSVNPATETMFGYSQSEMIDQNVKMLMPNPYRDLHDDFLTSYLQTGTRRIIGIGRETEGRRQDGSTFHIHVAVSEFTVDGTRWFTGVVRDISDLKKIERQLAETNEQLEQRVQQRTRELEQAQSDLVRSEKYSTLGKVAGSIAHEIRNPLNAVKTSAYFLLNAKQPTQEKTREHLERIERQVTSIDNVITALTDVVRLPESSLQQVNPESILRDAVCSIQFDANIQIIFDVAAGLPPVWVDESQIMIAFRNLIRNARDAMPDGGTLTLRAVQENDFVDLIISDSGIGISPENLERILEPLFTTKARGMGLGLSITQTIVEKNKGQLSVTSEPGVGSEFCIRLRTKQLHASKNQI